MCNYPPGAQYDSRAPYNQPDPEPDTVEIIVSCTFTKRCTIDIYEDEDIYDVVKDQVSFPKIDGWDFEDWDVEWN